MQSVNSFGAWMGPLGPWAPVRRTVCTPVVPPLVTSVFVFTKVESFDKTQHAREAEEAKGLWELELRARSKLGAKVGIRSTVIKK